MATSSGVWGWQSSEEKRNHPDPDIGCFYEGGETKYGEIVFARFSLE
jgi:hypothetical protein